MGGIQHYIATGPTVTVAGATGLVDVTSTDGRTVTLSGAGTHLGITPSQREVDLYLYGKARG